VKELLNVLAGREGKVLTMEVYAVGVSEGLGFFYWEEGFVAEDFGPVVNQRVVLESRITKENVRGARRGARNQDAGKPDSFAERGPRGSGACAVCSAVR
jgi:hypothetical protein